MKSQEPGADTSDIEIVNIDGHGVWLYLKGAEYFLPYTDYPWFKEAKVVDILDVHLLHEDHLHWPALDVDLSVESLRDPASYPLIYR